MVSGNIGSASLKRLDYAVNLAIAQPGQILVTAATYERLKKLFQCQAVGEVRLKGKARPVMTYEVLS